MDMSMDTHMDTSIDIHMDMSMDIHMEMPIKSKVSKLDGLYIQSEPAASRALRRWSNNPSAEGRWPGMLRAKAACVRSKRVAVRL